MTQRIEPLLAMLIGFVGGVIAFLLLKGFVELIKFLVFRII